MRISDWSSDVCSSDLDAAELRLQQPHWLPLETRPANLEGQGEITIGDLVKNALRMRPDRIILGEIRGAECFDLLAAMNTGHDGSMCTLHANSPRECLGRMENMILMGDIKIPKEAISRQIADSVRSEEHTSELQSLMRISYAVFCLKKKNT